MADKKDSPDQAGAENPDADPPANAPARDPSLEPVYSMEGYPPLPVIDLNGDLREQVCNLNELSLEIEERLLMEITAGSERLAEMGMSQAEFAAQYGAEFASYHFAGLEYDCIVPGAEMSALYLELIRISIHLLYKESIHRENKADKRRPLFSGTESGDVLSNSGALTESPNSDDPPSDAQPLSSESSSVDAESLPLHRDPEMHRSTISSSLNTDSAINILESLKVISNRLTALDPATVEFVGRLQGLVRHLESRYSTAEESLELTSADVSDLGQDSGRSNANADPTSRNASSASYASCVVPSDESTGDIANLPEDKPEEKPKEDDGDPPK